MTVTERLMGIGEWSLSLRDDTPRAVMDRLDVRTAGFSQIVITPTPVDIQSLGDGALPLARYVGVYRKQPSDYGMAGAGLAMYVADEDGKGPVYTTPIGGSGATFAFWATTLRPSSLTAGITSTFAGQFTKIYNHTNLRDPLDDVCSYFGAEWSITNDFKFNIGLPSALFATTPRAVITAKEGEGGRDFGIVGVTGDLGVQRDLEDWTRRVDYFTGSEASPALTLADGGVAANDIPYRTPSGAALPMDRIIEDYSGTTGTDATGLANAQFGRFRNPRQQLSLSSRQYDIGQDVRVGDNVYVYDPVRGIRDMTKQINYRGKLIYPETIRCVGLDGWPIRQGMGVYFRYWTRPASTWVLNWLDLTNYMKWETGDTTIEVGAKPR